MPITTEHNPKLAEFFSHASAKQDRVITEHGHVTHPGTFHRGKKYAAISEEVFKRDFPRYYQENLQANLDLLKALLKEQPAEVATLAYSLLEPSAKRGAALTERKLLEVKSLISEVNINSKPYEKRLKLFDSISQDPRLQACIEAHNPGKMDGYLQEVKQAAKTKAKAAGPGIALNLLLPGIGPLISAAKGLHASAKNADREVCHNQLMQLAALPNRSSSLALAIGQVLSHHHADLSTQGAINATVDTSLAGLGTFGLTGVSRVGVMPIAKAAVEEAFETSAAKTLASASVAMVPTATNFSLNSGLKSLATTYAATVLPRLEIHNHKGNFTLNLQEPQTVYALLSYLGPSENTQMTNDSASPLEKEIEQARLSLKAELGSPASEELIPDIDPILIPEQDVRKTSDKAYQKLLSEDYNWLVPAIKLVDEKKFDQIDKTLSYSLPLEFDGKTVYLEKSPKLEASGLIGAMKEDGSPSLLRLLYLAEDWL